MSIDLLMSWIPLAAVVAAITAGIVWLDRTNTLRLSLFRPYRGDPWPHGVQEEDDVHWQWTRGRRPADDDRPDPVDVVHLGRISIRRPRGR
jgi:hypothetical protein